MLLRIMVIVDQETDVLSCANVSALDGSVAIKSKAPRSDFPVEPFPAGKTERGALLLHLGKDSGECKTNKCLK